MPPAFLGKSGADAVFKALSRVCIILGKYQVKLEQAIDAAVEVAVITPSQATQAKAFLATAVVVCHIFELVSSVSGF